MSEQSLIVVKQLPVIEEQLKTLSEEISKELANVNNLVCTEDNLKEVKKIRANYNNRFKEFETQRKNIKEQVFQPWDNFEKTYKECVTEKFKDADAKLKEKIDAIENELRANKEKEIKEYFEEYKVANNIDFITYEQAKINVTLTVSKKSLQEQCKVFIDKINDDLKLIETQEHKAAILVEYKQTLNASKAITTVASRFKAIEEEKKRQEELQRKQEEKRKRKEELKANIIQQMPDVADKTNGVVIQEDKEKITEFIDRAVERDNKPLEQPKVEEKEEILTVKFTVRGTKTKLRELKQFLENGGFDYE